MSFRSPAQALVVLLLLSGAIRSYAEKELIYDPEKGIIFVEKGSAPATTPTSGRSTNRTASSSKKPATTQRKTAARRGKSSNDIHVGRHKDPPKLYFKSGLEYFKNSDFVNALKNFSYADSVAPKPEYTLWIGKTLRQLDRSGEMLKTMFDIIKNQPDSDVADDALFEIALYYQAQNDYEKASQLFTRMIEQYPFGLSYPSGEELRELARNERRRMRAEMINILTTIGFIGEDLPASYLIFQKAFQLPFSSVGDQVTINAIKEQHRLYLEKEQKKLDDETKIGRYRLWIYGAIGAGCLNVLLLLILTAKVRSRKKHLEELSSLISDLDIKKL